MHGNGGRRGGEQPIQIPGLPALGRLADAFDETVDAVLLLLPESKRPSRRSAAAWVTAHLERLSLKIDPHALVSSLSLRSTVLGTRARRVARSVHQLAVAVHLDDFGTGYSSLSQLRSLPFDRIKIDRSFVTNLAISDDNAAIVHAIAMLGQEGLFDAREALGAMDDDTLARDELREGGDIGVLPGQPRSPLTDHGEQFVNRR